MKRTVLERSSVDGERERERKGWCDRVTGFGPRVSSFPLSVSLLASFSIFEREKPVIREEGNGKREEEGDAKSDKGVKTTMTPTLTMTMTTTMTMTILTEKVVGRLGP